jgi:hypothetical protein
VVIAVQDALAAQLSGVRVLWTIEGAAGMGSTGEANTDPMGNATLNPGLPSKPGPFVLDVRVRWADGPPVILNGFVRPQPMELDLGGRAAAYSRGMIGPNKEDGVAVLVAGVGGDKVDLIYKDAASGMIGVRTSPPIRPGSVLGIIDQAGRDRDRVIAVGATNWDEIAPDGTIAGKSYSPPMGGTLPVHILTTGSCTGNTPQDAPYVLIEFVEDVFGIYPSDGGAPVDAFRLTQATDPTPAHMLATGCASDQSSMPLRTWAIDFGSGIGVILAVPNGTNTPLLSSWLTLPEGVAFSPPVGMNARRLIFGTQISVNDIVVSRASFDHEMDMLKLVVEGFDTVPGVPSYTAAGDIDGDGNVDAASLFQRSGATQTSPKPAMWAVLGRQHGGRRISGDIDLPDPQIRNPVLLLSDLDGDGTDDIIIGEVVDKVGDANAKADIYLMAK